MRKLVLVVLMVLLPFSVVCKHASATDLLFTWTAPGDNCDEGTASIYEMVRTQDPTVRDILLGSDLPSDQCRVGGLRGISRIGVDALLSGRSYEWITTYDSTLIAPSVSGTAEQAIVPGFTQGTWYVLFRAVDEAKNYSSWAIVIKVVDEIHPAAILNLK